MPPKEDATDDRTSAFDEPTDNPLPQDGATPFSLPSEEEEESKAVPRDHPAFDSASNLDAHEAYDEGLEGAAEVDNR